MEEMDRYRSCTSVTLGNGATTSFWFDSWLHETPLSTLFSALFSHVLGPDTTVQFVFQHDFDLHLRPRLTTTTGRHSFAMCQKHTANHLPCYTRQTPHGIHRPAKRLFAVYWFSGTRQRTRWHSANIFWKKIK